MGRVNNRLSINILFTGLMQFCNYLIPFLVIPFISRRVGIEKMASIEYINSIVQFGIVIISYGFDFTASRRISTNRDKKETLNLIFNTISIVKFLLLILTFLSICTTMILSSVFDDITKGLIGASFIFIGFMINPWWFYQGLEKIKTVSIANALIKILSGVLMIIFIQQPQDYYLYFTLIGLTQVLVSFYFYIDIYKKYKFSFYLPQQKYLYNIIKEGFAVFFSELSILFFTYTNVLILGSKVPNYELAQYTTPNRILIIVQTLIIASFQKALYPYLTNLFKKSKQEYFVFMKKIKYLVLTIMLVCSLCTFFLRECIIFIVFGKEHLISAPILSIIALIFPFVGLANIYGWQGLLVMKKDKQLTLTTTILGIVNVSLLYIIPLSPFNMAILRVLMEALLALACFALFTKAIKYAK